MTNEQILKKAIEKAERNGWINPEDEVKNWWYDVSHRYGSGWVWGLYKNSIIFSHEFAKALWGDKKKLVGQFESQKDYIPSWQYHLQEMVLEENPVKYLEKFL